MFIATTKTKVSRSVRSDMSLDASKTHRAPLERKYDGDNGAINMVLLRSTPSLRSSAKKTFRAKLIEELKSLTLDRRGSCRWSR